MPGGKHAGKVVSEVRRGGGDSLCVGSLGARCYFSVSELGITAHRRSPHQPNRGTAAVEPGSGHAARGGDCMTLPAPPRNRAHNLPIMGTIQNETEHKGATIDETLKYTNGRSVSN